MSINGPLMEHLGNNVVDDDLHMCDSPSGSSTSEPHDELIAQQPNKNHSLFYNLDSFSMNDNNLMYVQHQPQQPQQPQQQQPQSISPSLSLSSPNMIDPLLQQTAMYQNPIFWSGFNNTIPNLTKNFTTGIPSRPGMQIRVLGVPQTGAKSRVETQIKLCIQLATNEGDKVQRWPHLRLPEHMVAKDKLKNQFISSPTSVAMQPEKTLFLDARVICASDPSRKVIPCTGCIQRECKRSQRKKENKIKLEEDDDTTADEQKILLFNCSELVDFSSGDTILPTRITCYCRHHNEKLGFCIYFELNDHTGKQLATGMTPPIMITDDHKSNKLKVGRKRLRPTNDDVIRQCAGPQYPIQPRPSSITPTGFRETPLIQRLIPNEGPTHGGVEITILGNGFRSGLTCIFGDVPAVSTHFWSPNTLVCILPPAADPGSVVVSFKGYPLALETQDVTLFTYFNENDRALMELALQVVGLKMTGKVEDAREIAMRIVQGGTATQTPSAEAPRQSSTNLEYQIMQILQVMCTTVRHVQSPDVSMRSQRGHTMLHLASMMGFCRLTQYLIEIGCEVNATDRNGFTALHYAVWLHHENVVAVLLEKGNADPEISNRWNQKPVHLTHSAIIQQRLKYHLVHSDYDPSDTDVSLTEEDWSSESDNEVFSEEGLVTSEGLRRRRRNPPQIIQYLEDEESTSFSAEAIVDALPVHDVQEDSDVEDTIEKEMTWMQRTLSHFPSDNSFLQNIKNNMPAKPSDLKTFADHLLQLPAPTMISDMFSTVQELGKREESNDQTFAWYMALAYAMGSLKEEEQKTDTASTSSSIQEVSLKRRDKRLFSFWVPLLCLMVSWLIFQFIYSHPSLVDTIIGISGFRGQYLSVQ